MKHSIQMKPIDLAETKKEVLREILDQKMRSGEIRSESEYEAQWKTFTDKLETPPLMEVRKQGGLTDADAFNDSLEELSLDLHILFAQINKIDETVNKHQRLNQSVMNNLKLRMKRIQDELTKYEYLANRQTSQRIHLETFLDSNSFEVGQALYTDRNGTSLPISYHARLDTEREAIKLPTIISQNALIGPGGVRLGRLKIKKQLGSGLIHIHNPEHTIDKAIDNSMDTFWAESLLVDIPIQVQMDNFYHNVDFGALVELEVEFDYLTQLNEFGFTTFGEYPMDIVAVKYYETDNTNEIAKELIYPQATNGLKSRTIEGSTSFQFQDIQAKRLSIVFNQRHYVKTDFIASRKNQKITEIWFKARAAELGDTHAHNVSVFQPVIQDRYEQQPSWKVFTEEIKVMDANVERIMELINMEDMRAISKYEYNYGLYNLSLRRNEYQNIGIYVSKEIPVGSNIRQISIETEEEHPLINTGTAVLPRFTDIEYYISDGSKWYPILPANAEKVKCELLMPQFNGTAYVAELRFPTETGLAVYRNGIDITTDIIQLDHTHIQLNDYDVSSVYTAEYQPGLKAKQIDFIKEYTDGLGNVKPRKTTEEFKGTDGKGTIILQQHPFVDRKKINEQSLDYNPTFLEQELNGYLPIKVKLIDKEGRHIEQPMNASVTGMRVENVTDYFNREVSHLQPYDESLGIYQYQVIDNMIQFNTVIPEGTRVIVEYPYLVSSVRIKSILRRNINGFHGLTPVLNHYAIEFNTLT